MSQIHVVHVTESVAQGMGGPARSVVGLCEGLARRGCRVSLCACDFGPGFGPPGRLDRSLVRLVQAPCLASKRLGIYLPRGFGRALARAAAGAGLIHSHGLWLSIHNDAARAARRGGIPHVISPQGMLQPASLRRSPVRKALARRLFVDRNLRRAACLHALTPRELAGIRALGLRVPVAVIPNGVDPAEFDPAADRDGARRRWPGLPDKRIALFLGRIHPIKGLDGLIRAWARLPAVHDQWHLAVAGPDEVGHLAALRRLAAAEGVARHVTFLGPVFDAGRLSLLASAELLVMPSLSEGFSVAVLEALASGLPVLLSTGCNFDQVVEAGAGMVVAPAPGPLEAGLREMTALSEGDRRRMGQAGRKLLREQYTQAGAAERTEAVYRWLLGQADRPPWVVM